MAIRLEGNWDKGLAFDVHTLDSEYLGCDEHGHKRWENTRSEMGELIYQLKYKQKTENVSKICDLISEKIKGLKTFDFIIPIPPTKNRVIQPVAEIAKELGSRNNIQVVNALQKMSSGGELKNISNPEKRKDALSTMGLTKDYNFSEKKILLLDDLYDSGATLRAATDILYKETNAEKISVLTMTKTGKN